MWNTVNLFIKMKYISITDYDGVIFRYSCDTLCTMKYYPSFTSVWPYLVLHFSKFITQFQSVSTNLAIKYYELKENSLMMNNQVRQELCDCTIVKASGQ